MNSLFPSKHLRTLKIAWKNLLLLIWCSNPPNNTKTPNLLSTLKLESKFWRCVFRHHKCLVAEEYWLTLFYWKVLCQDADCCWSSALPWRRRMSACCCIPSVFCAAGPVSAAPLSGARLPAATRLWSARCIDPEGRCTRRCLTRFAPPPAGLQLRNLASDNNIDIHSFSDFPQSGAPRCREQRLTKASLSGGRSGDANE